MNPISSPSQTPAETISTILAVDEEYPPPKVVAQGALQEDFRGEYRRSIEDPEGFWGEQARAFHWDHKWQRVLDWEGARHQCFVQLRAGHRASDTLAAVLVDHVRRELCPIATPAGIKFVEALPKTRGGKILRRYLKARELGADTGDLSTLDA